MTVPETRLSFPDGPRSALDQALSELVLNAQKVLATQGRLRSLLQASQAVVEELDLAAVLRRIVDVAVDLVGAQYGALGVIAPSGNLEQFIHVGIPDELAARIGHLPAGHGLLGALIDDPHAIRLTHLGDDPRSSGFPAHHPPMDSFLGVPVRVRGEVYGNLYLSNQISGGFSEEDEELLTALAATAGIAIDNARLFDETRRRQRWSAASAEISAALLSDRADASLELLADRFASLADADLVCVVLAAGEGTLIVDTARGTQAKRVKGLVIPSTGTTVGRAFDSGQPILTADGGASLDQPDAQLVLGPTMVIPLLASGRTHGVMTVSRSTGRPRFTTSDLEMAADFAGQASVALELARGRTAGQKLALLEDRSRIARDLHDNVIQRVFAAGIGLQAISGSVDDADVRERIIEEVVALDVAIVEIRTAIFALTAQTSRDRGSIRHRVIDLLSELASLFPQTPRLVFTGPIDLLTPPAMSDDIAAVIREGLMNVVRHAEATETVVNLSVGDDLVVIEVVDNGVGVTESDRRSGLANLAARAEQWGGDVVLENRARGGSRLRWTAGIEPEPVRKEPS
ncbi:GAF domain-containing protein [Cryobacterium arcticum]|uniref:Two-component system histidine kinase n=1 Tax=Cryobacterium arcticum TaxID=670052 RepID=A0A1B1BJ19_9MICO|nr:GAF domain-containing protein [Cryobacterium arcticum]ANP72637.1 Two-component system histidine kinase [Cryobacterium arcticum]